MTKPAESRWRKFSDAAYDMLIVRVEGEERSWSGASRLGVWEMLKIAPVVLILGTIAFFLYNNASEVYASTTSYLGPRRSQLIYAALVCGGGFLAHWYKQRNQRRYGIVEVVVGMLSAFGIALSMSSSFDFAKWASLIGAGYVIARGRNNISDARQKELLGP